MLTYRSGPLAGLLAQFVLLAALQATIGLSVAAWVVGHAGDASRLQRSRRQPEPLPRVRPWLRGRSGGMSWYAETPDWDRPTW